MIADVITTYRFRGEIYCYDCILGEVQSYDDRDDGPGSLDTGAYLRSTEEILNRWAEIRGYDRNNETSFSSDEFPKDIYGRELDSLIDTSTECDSCEWEITR